jgi:hypothetical protein
MSSSFVGPAVMPSGGSLVRLWYSFWRRRWAVFKDMVARVFQQQEEGERLKVYVLGKDCMCE